MRRAANETVADKLQNLIEWWRNYAESNGSKLDNNPSHGNKAGGLTTIHEKSLGAVAKTGSTIAGESSTAKIRSMKWAARYSTRFLKLHQDERPAARNSASVTTNSCPGCSAHRCKRHIVFGGHPGCARHSLNEKVRAPSIPWSRTGERPSSRRHVHHPRHY